jgi:Zn-finger nucleic acid-binding protein
VDLVMTERQGIEIDYCPKCRGVWLDRGELDKIIERNAAETRVAPVAATPSPWTAPPPQDPAPPTPAYGAPASSHGWQHGGGHHGQGRGHNSFLGRLFG